MKSLNVLYKYQFGVRHNHSTQQAIITQVNEITSSLYSGHLVIGVFIDLKKLLILQTRVGLARGEGGVPPRPLA